MTWTLVESLKLFNRKERYWLIRNALGCSDVPIPLSDEFRENLSKVTSMQVPKDAWWAIDYHIDWLAGALVHYDESHTAPDKVYSNPVVDENSRERLIRGSQEDFDFIVGFNNTIILIEAKFATGWSKAQIKSKIDRLNSLTKLPLQSDYFAKEIGDVGVAIYFVMMWPRPNGDERPPEDRSLHKPIRGPYLLNMVCDTYPKRFLAVERYDANKAGASREGTHWRLKNWKNPSSEE